MRKLFFVVVVCLWSTGYAADTVPFRAQIITNVQFTGSCGPACLSLSITGSGLGLHFGHITITGPSQINLATLTQTGSSVLVASNGSTALMSFAGTFVPGATPDVATFQGSWTIGSGTGRFEGETGSGTYSGSAAGSIGVLNLDGVLSNPGNR